MSSVAIGGPLSPEQEAALRRQQRAELVAQLEAEVAAVEEKLSGWKEALSAKKAELREARSAKKGDE